MHIQIVNFNLKGVSEADYAALCDHVAPFYAAVPGLLAKVWLADPATNTYGGLYTWQDQQMMAAFQHSDMVKALRHHAHLVNYTSKDFGVLEAPSLVTRGLAVALA